MNKMKKTTFELFAPPGEMFWQDIQQDHCQSLYRDPQLHTTCVSGKTHGICGYTLRVLALCPKHCFLVTPAFTAAFLKVGENEASFTLYHPSRHCIFKAVHLKYVKFSASVRGQKCRGKSERPLQSIQPATWKNEN